MRERKVTVGEGKVEITAASILAEARSAGNKCSLAAFVAAKLTATEAKVIALALPDRTYGVMAIWRLLAARGFERSHQVVERHRRDGCRACKLPRRDS